MIEAIYIAAGEGETQHPMQVAEVRAGLGIVGDRHYGQKKGPGRNVTFIEKEAVAKYNSEFGQSISLSATRRNVVTKGVRLNDLVGKRFKIGDAYFVGVELCEPCKRLGDSLTNEFVSSSSVVKAFVHRGGLRADVLIGGVISVGAELEPIG